MNLSGFDFAPVMHYPAPENLKVFDLSGGADTELINQYDWGIGRYNERRQNVYTTPLFGGKRNIHMGIDIWAAAGTPVFSFWEGKICYLANNDQPGDYGPTLILRYHLEEQKLYALYGHLSKMTLENISVGETVQKGQQIATTGSEEVNGGWPPHLHFQLALQDPGKADMPGVVAEEDRAEALEKYPDPRLVLGSLYE